jgi:hypothetical protein
MSSAVHQKIALSLIAAALCTACATETTVAADTSALIGQLGQGCKNRVVEQFDVPNSDITVRPGSTLQSSLDGGSMSAADLRRDGASFDWEVAGKQASGYCNVDGTGQVVEFKQW